jgi:histidyl-tRNA synthetase
MAQSTNPARGMRDFLPADIKKRNYVINIIKEVYESYGFEPLETPAVENLETLTGKYGEEGNQLMFKILKRGEKLDLEHGEKGLSDLALRYDLTVPLARVAANYKNELPKFFKRYQIQPVWRADRPARGRYREFYQCDVDAIGSNSMVVETELISAVCEVFKQLGFNDFVVRLNHRQLLSAILDSAEVPENKQTDALIAFDKFDKIGAEGVKKELIERGISENSINKIITFYQSIGVFKSASRFGQTEQIKENTLSNENPIQFADFEDTIVKSRTIATLKKIDEFIGENNNGKQATHELLNIFSYLSKINPEQINYAKKIKIDASLARGLSYYTGTIIEVNVPEFNFSLVGGGRYDGLIGMFGKETIPACGLSIGLERILFVMEERGMFPPELQQNSADVMVTIWNEDSIAESLQLANELRSQGLRVLVYPEADKLGKQFKYANSINIPYVCILGESELAENKVTLKNMQTVEQETIARDEIISKISK